jgi:ubiquinol-cytochrome c reductase cytochrome c1 subunit
MRKIFFALLLCAAPVLAQAEEGPQLDTVKIDLHDKASLQRGAKFFVNYCMGCHSASYERYNAVAKHLGLSDEQMMQNLVFAGDKIGDYMTISTSPADAKKWFGATPPDLTVIARARGIDWLYTYLRSFYLDPKRPFGVNNVVFKDVGMPHVLWELQGWQKPVYKTVTGEDGKPEQVLDKLEIVTPGTMSPDDYDAAVTDLVNFLAYMGEPAKLERQSLGIKVLLFLAVFFVIAYLLKKDYWQDIH